MSEERPRCQDTVNGEPCEGHLTVCTRHPYHDSHKRREDITFSNEQLLPLTRLLLQGCTTLSLYAKITFDPDYGPHVMVIDVDTSELDFTDNPADRCVKCDARVYDNPKDELCADCRKDDKEEKL